MQKRIVILLFLFFNSFIIFSQSVVADHTVVDKYNTIPQYYIDQVKKMWVSFAGESHSLSYGAGCEFLERLDNRFQVNVQDEGTPEAYTASHLRVSRATWGSYGASETWIYSYGEEDWFTNPTAISRTKEGLLYCKDSGPFLAALGFAWCWDANNTEPLSGGYDPVYNTRWSGESEMGPQGSRAWGLDAADQALTGNSVCMDTYLNATEEYINYCIVNNIPTKIIFTTGPIDNLYNFGEEEEGYQRYLKYRHIRNYINSSGNKYLFDFADILSYNNAGVQETTEWMDNNGQVHVFPIMSDENKRDFAGDYDWNTDYHFGQQGALKIGKAVWWLLARIAGWDGTIKVTGILVTGAGGSNTIATDYGTLQLSAAISPANATNQSVTWSIENGTGQASINSTGLVTAISGGTVTARATANDGSGIYGTLVITIPSYIWQGGYNSNFSNASNWRDGVVPPDNSNISFVANPGNNCILDINRTIRNITNTQAMSRLVINGRQLTITGNLNFSGGAQLDASLTGSVLVFNGSSAQNIPAGAFSGNTISGLRIENLNGVRLNGNLIVTQDLIIASASRLSLSPSTSLIVSGTLINNSGISGLVLESDLSGNAALLNNSSLVNATVELDLSGGIGTNGARFHYFIPAVQSMEIGANITSAKSSLSLTSFNGDLLAYSEPAAISDMADGWKYFDGFPYGTTPGEPFSIIESIKGYNIYLTGNDKIKLKGQLNAASHEFNLTCTSSNKSPGWNLIGNPYPCNYDLHGINALSQIGNDGIDNTVYFTREGGYVYWNVSTGVGIGWTSDFIPPMQGFFVHVTAPGRSLNLPINSKTILPNSPRAKGDTKNNSGETKKIKLELSKGNVKDEAVVCLINEATAQYDGDFDAYKLFGTSQNVPFIYTESGNVKYAINSVGEPGTDSVIVPVSVKIINQGTYKIEATEFENLEGFNVVFKHGSLKTKMNKNASYLFMGEPGTYDDFQLVIAKRTSDIDNITTETLKTWYSNDFLYIRFPAEISFSPGSLIIYNLQGKMVYNNLLQITPGFTIQLPVNLPPGMFITHVIVNKQHIISKIVIPQ